MFLPQIAYFGSTYKEKKLKNDRVVQIVNLTQTLHAALYILLVGQDELRNLCIFLTDILQGLLGQARHTQVVSLLNLRKNMNNTGNIFVICLPWLLPSMPW